MHRLLTALGALGSGFFLAIACSENKVPNLFPGADAGPLGAGGSGGSSTGGAGGSGGTAGTGGGAGGSAGVGGADLTGGSGGQDAGSGDAGCTSALDCDDQNDCTIESCEGGVCVASGFAPSGAACGNRTNDACTAPDTCDGAGVCQPNNIIGSAGLACGSPSDSACNHADSCDAQGVCQPNNEPLGAACGNQTPDECSGPDQCDEDGQCSPNNFAAGTACGDTTDNECAHPDVCGSGVCLPNDEPNGTACTGGSCTQGQCISGQPVGCPVDVASSVPFNTTWSSVERPNLYVGSCDSANTPDYALVFTAPAAGTFRFTAHALVDSTPYTGADSSPNPTQPPDGDAVLTVANGSCAGQAATQLGCNDDVAVDSIDSQLDLVLGAQQQVTVYLNERTQTGGGTGTLSITQL